MDFTATILKLIIMINYIMIKSIGNPILTLRMYLNQMLPLMETKNKMNRALGHLCAHIG